MSSNQKNLRSAVTALSSTSSSFGTVVANGRIDQHANGLDEHIKLKILAEEEAAMNQFKVSKYCSCITQNLCIICRTRQRNSTRRRQCPPPTILSSRRQRRQLWQICQRKRNPLRTSSPTARPQRPLNHARPMICCSWTIRLRTHSRSQPTRLPLHSCQWSSSQIISMRGWQMAMVGLLGIYQLNAYLSFNWSFWIVFVAGYTTPASNTNGGGAFVSESSFQSVFGNTEVKSKQCLVMRLSSSLINFIFHYMLIIRHLFKLAC